jgi:hypothetical protein
MWTKQGWRYWEKRYEHDLKKEKEEKEEKEEKARAAGVVVMGSPRSNKLS